MKLQQGDYVTNLTEEQFEGCNKLSKWRLDGKWRISNSDRNTITITELEKILKNGKEN